MNPWDHRIGSYTPDEFLKLMMDDTHYYGDTGKLALSASTLKDYYETELPEKREFKNSDALVFGNWFHKVILEP